MNTIAHRLRSLRGSQSQAEFAKFLGIPSQQTYANYERGRVPKTPTLEKIAARCRVPLLWLLTGSGTRQPLRDALALPDPPDTAPAAAILREDAARYGVSDSRPQPLPVEALATDVLLDLVADMPDHIAAATNATIRSHLVREAQLAADELRRRMKPQQPSNSRQ